MKIRTSVIILQVISLAFSIGMSAQDKAPAEWVAQLGADHLADREAASAALLALGAKGREAVHGALDSQDAEVRARARKLWETLRWDVIPEAEADTATLIATIGKKPAYSSNTATDEESKAWTVFVDKHGVASFLLISELCKASVTWCYNPGIERVLATASTNDFAGLFLHAGGEQRADLESALDALPPEYTPGSEGIAMINLRMALGECGKALAFGRTLGHGSDDTPGLDEACATAIQRGGLFNEEKISALGEIAGEKDPNKLCRILSFEINLMTALHKKDEVPVLCDAARGADPAEGDTYNSPRLIESLERAGLPEIAVKMLRDKSAPFQLYLRSHAEAAAKDDRAAAADWEKARGALDKMDNAKKKDASFEIANQMVDWNDPKAEALLRKILASPPEDSYADGNSSFYLAQILEDKKDYAEAADLYQKGFDLSHGAVIIWDKESGQSYEPKDWVRDKVKELRAKAAEAKASPTVKQTAQNKPSS